MRRSLLLLALLALLASAVQTNAVSSAPLTAGPAGTSPPSVVFIVTDDQRAGTVWAMPNTMARLVRNGVSFTNAFVTDPSCCPSRASILTGAYSHTTGIWRNDPPHGGVTAFDPWPTLATRLRTAGYRTGLFGKYLNGYRGFTRPPGWTRWVAFTGVPAYYGYRLRVNGAFVNRGTAPQDYSTDVLAGYAEAFIRNQTGPLFVLFAPWGPHAPARPAPRHAGTFSSLPPFSRPNFNEADVSDKPAWVQLQPKLTSAAQAEVQAFRRDQFRTLRSVDDAVDRILDALVDTGRIADTIIVLTSDNGLSWGEHRWRNKLAPYEEDIRVPLVIRYDPLTGKRETVDPRLALNIDLMRTVAELTGVAPISSDGRSLAPLLAGEDPVWREDFLVENLFWGTWIVPPTYCAVRTERYKYVLNEGQRTELYDLELDPWELKNRIADPAYVAVRDAMHVRLVELCDPPPPGLVVPPEPVRLAPDHPGDAAGRRPPPADLE